MNVHIDGTVLSEDPCGVGGLVIEDDVRPEILEHVQLILGASGYNGLEVWVGITSILQDRSMEMVNSRYWCAVSLGRLTIQHQQRC